MMPGTCCECGGPTGYFHIMEKDGEIKLEVCPECKEKLEKEEWKVVGSGLH
jgi:hypothetical protein